MGLSSCAEYRSSSWTGATGGLRLFATFEEVEALVLGFAGSFETTSTSKLGIASNISTSPSVSCAESKSLFTEAAVRLLDISTPFEDVTMPDELLAIRSASLVFDELNGSLLESSCVSDYDNNVSNPKMCRSKQD